MKIPELIRQYTSPNPGKRKNQRLALSLPLEYCSPGSTSPHLAYTIDISEGGLSMHVLQRLENGQKLKVKVYYDAGPKIDCIELFGEVIRVDSLPKSEGYRCSVIFVDLSSETMKELRKFLKSLY